MSNGQLGWIEKMTRFLEGRDEEQHPQFMPAGQRFLWEPPKNSGLKPHRGMTGHWKSGPPGTLVYCLDCPIRTHARRNGDKSGRVQGERLRRDISTWRLRHNRVAKIEITNLKKLQEEKLANEKRLSDLADLVEKQGAHGNWNYDNYMLGLFNGLELASAVLEGRTPRFRKKPDDGWLADKAIELKLAAAEGLPVPADKVLEAYAFEAAKAGEDPK